MNKRVMRGFTVSFILIAVLFLAPPVIFGQNPPAWIPELARNYLFDVQLAAAPFTRKLSSIANGSFLDDRVYLDSFGETIEFTSGELKIVGTLYQPSIQEKVPGILLIHGGTSEGRKLGIYRFLGKELAKRGYVILSIDRRGFGDSDDPKDIDEIYAWSEDLTLAIEYLSSFQYVDRERLFVIGHSGGADSAIPLGINDPRILKIVAIGPPRRVQERLGSVANSDFGYFLRRAMRERGLEEPIPLDVYLSHVEEMDLESYLDYFSSDQHKPILLIDGILENEKDREYLSNYVHSITEPKAYITLSDADHYANIANLGPIVFFDQRVADELVTAIDDWLSGE